jgi:ATP-binding cassette subfamily F protein 3
VLLGLRFEPDQFQRDIGTMSGGQQSRAVLARLLLQSPDLMLLDEPTNHLDISAISWLEDYLQRQESALLVVSHDRYFLDKVINKVFELQNGKLTVYPGNYSQYQALRLERQKVSDRQATRQQEEIARLSEFVRRNKAGQLSKQAKSREKMIDRISSESIERVRDLGIPPMTFGEPTRAGDIVVSMRGVSKRFAHTLFSEVDLEIERGQRVGIVGPNGAGKTTLLRMMLGEESATSGVIKLGHNIRLGFLRQEVDDLDPSLSCLDAVRPAWKIGEKEETFRGLLARFGINADVCENRVRSLSGGQRSRVALARIAAHEVNVLVLDEPTNHLDLWAVQALEEAITAFAGTVIVVSHDRAFLNNVCQRLVVIQGEKVRLIPGNYDRYVQILADESAREPIVKEKPKPADSKPKRKRKYPFRKANEIERDIEATDGKIAELEASLNDPAVFTDGRRLENVSAEIAQLKKESARLLEHWEESMELNS